MEHVILQVLKMRSVVGAGTVTASGRCGAFFECLQQSQPHRKLWTLVLSVAERFWSQQGPHLALQLLSCANLGQGSAHLCDSVSSAMNREILVPISAKLL